MTILVEHIRHISSVVVGCSLQLGPHAGVGIIHQPGIFFQSSRQFLGNCLAGVLGLLQGFEFFRAAGNLQGKHRIHAVSVSHHCFPQRDIGKTFADAFRNSLTGGQALIPDGLKLFFLGLQALKHILYS